MKKSVNSNMYAFQFEATREHLADHLSGAPESIVCVLSTAPLSEQARQALDSSCKALGFDTTCSFLTRCTSAIASALVPATSENQRKGENLQKQAPDQGLQGHIPNQGLQEHALAPTPIDNELKGSALFAALEGLDPIMLIITDEASRQACAEVYRTEIPQNNKGRLFGRTLVSFQDFESLLASPESKQRAWALLKRLAPTR